MKIHPTLIEVENLIETRSKDSRSSYLNKLKDSKEHNKSARNNMGCSNFAHAFASCDKDQQAGAAEGKKVIGIVSAYNDMLSAHAPLKDYPDIIKNQAKKKQAIARVAGGVPAMCDGVTQGEPGMELSLFSRDVIALSTGVAFSHNVFDGGICLGVCDKIVPGLMIGALTFGHMPIAFMPAGPMPSGISNIKKTQTRNAFAAGDIDRSELIASEQAAYHTSGTCTFYGTANTNQLIMEIMGIQLPGSSFTPPGSKLRDGLIKKTVDTILELSNKDISFGEMITAKSWVNGIVALLASGGSTNLTIHLIAMAAAGGYKITLEDIDLLSKKIPILTNVYPNGSADVNEFHQAGGIAALTSSLLKGGMLFNDVDTILGRGLSQYTKLAELKDSNVVWINEVKILDQGIIRDANNPFKKSGGIKLMQGNMGKGIIKTSALKTSETIKTEALVFNCQNKVIDAFNKGDLNKDCIIVVRGQGPSANGMPELHKLTSPINVLQSKGYKIALITDGRMSGASGSFPAIIHVTPEAKNDGAIGKINNGDEVIIDIKSGLFSVNLTNEELASRNLCELNNSNQGVGRELFNIFRSNVGSTEDGASIFMDNS